MHLKQFFQRFAHQRMRLGVLCSLMVILALAFSACAGDEPDVAEPEPAAEEPAAEEPAAEPAEEAEEEPVATEDPEEEPVATEEPEEEPAETAEPEEEPMATAEPEEEPAATPEPEEEPSAAADVDHGQYIMTIAGCGCHFNSDEGALAGGNRFQGSFGEVHAANITPDEETGIGSWSEDEIADALRFGMHPEGYQLVQVMPYARFSVLSDEEALAVAASLLAQDPVANEVPARDVSDEPEPFTPEDSPPAEPPTDPVARGEQLVTVANCTDCHTPDNGSGPDVDMYMAGAPLPEDDIAANITPHEETGIGSWSEAEIAEYLRTGVRPDGSLAGGVMADRIDERFNILTEEDALAIAAYLKSIPAVENDPYE